MSRAILAACVLCGCAHPVLNTPSGAGVSSGIGRIGTSVQEARKYNDVAVVHNANAMTRVQRIEAKTAVIQKYWKSNDK